jgi:hypothetical protein
MGFVVLNLWVSLLCFVGFYGVRSTESLGFSVVFCMVFMEFGGHSSDQDAKINTFRLITIITITEE